MHQPRILTLGEAVRVIGPRLAAAGHPRTADDDLVDLDAAPLLDRFARSIAATLRQGLENFAILATGKSEPVGIYARAAIELDRAIRIGEIATVDGLIRARDIDAQWPPLPGDDAEPAPASKAAAAMAPGIRSRGPRPEKRNKTKEKMKADVACGKLTNKMLADMKEESAATMYNVSRDTVRKARNEVLSESVDD